jgi:hypothetical protein
VQLVKYGSFTGCIESEHDNLSQLQTILDWRVSRIQSKSLEFHFSCEINLSKIKGYAREEYPHLGIAEKGVEELAKGLTHLLSMMMILPGIPQFYHLLFSISCLI